MRYLKLIALLAALLYQSTYARYQRRGTRSNTAMPALQNILGRGIDERQIMQMMQAQSRRPPTVETYMQANGVNALAQLPKPVQPKCPCQMQQQYPKISEMTRVPNLPYVTNVPSAPATPVSPMPAMPVSPISAMPWTPMPEIPVPVTAMPTLPNIPEILTRPVSIMPAVQENFENPYASTGSLVSPFLPAASPVSAWAPPTSNQLPPVTANQGRSHFLRKIPIPPPTL